MLRSPAVLRRSLFVLALALLLKTMGVSLQDATAQTPTFNVEQPTASLQRALLVAEDDSQLVDLATALMEARADTEISQSTYKEGVRYFRTFHPQFYGNFFGHPYYATFDSEYVYMSRLRGLATREADLQSGLSGLFSCHPRWYDPAFGGECEYQFASFQFLLLPDGSLPSIVSVPSFQNPKPVRVGEDCHSEWCEPLLDEFLQYNLSNRERPVRSSPPSSGKPGRADIPKDPVDNIDKTEPPSPSEIETPGELVQTPDRRIDLPDDVHASMLKTATSLRQKERALRLRNLVEQKRNGAELSTHERARVVSALSGVVSSNGPTRVTPRNSSQGRTPSRINRGTMNRRSASNASGTNGSLKGVDLPSPKLPEPPPKHPDVEVPNRGSVQFPELGQPGGPSNTGPIKVANPQRSGNSLRINAPKIRPAANSPDMERANSGGGGQSATPREPNVPEPSRSVSPETSEDTGGN